MPLLVFENIWFSYGANLLFYGSRVRGRFSLSVVRSITCKFNMLFRLLWRSIKFMIVYFFQVLTSNNLVECILAPPRVCFFPPINNLRIEKL
jgi:hypothetical protein